MVVEPKPGQAIYLKFNLNSISNSIVLARKQSGTCRAAFLSELKTRAELRDRFLTPYHLRTARRLDSFKFTPIQTTMVSQRPNATRGGGWKRAAESSKWGIYCWSCGVLDDWSLDRLVLDRWSCWKWGIRLEFERMVVLEVGNQFEFITGSVKRGFSFCWIWGSKKRGLGIGMKRQHHDSSVDVMVMVALASCRLPWDSFRFARDSNRLFNRLSEWAARILELEMKFPKLWTRCHTVSSVWEKSVTH